MKKTLLIYLSILFLPILASAQIEPPIIEDFTKGAKTINNFAFNDHLNIVQVTTEDDSFDIVAVNDKMQIVWTTTLAGYGIKTDKLNGKIIALASSDHSYFKGITNTYQAYVINPGSGKVLANKVVYKSTDEYMEFPQIYTGEGKFFKLAVRQSGYKRKIHFNINVFGAGKYAREFNETKKLEIVEFDDNLDSIRSFKPAISNGTFISLAWNKNADLFIGWLNGPSIEVYKYDVNKTAPSNQLTVPVSLKEDKDIIPGKSLLLQPSQNSDVLYYSLIYRNQDKDMEVGIGKLDFNNGKKVYVTQGLNKSDLKAIKKEFKPVNKDFDNVDFGYPAGMNLKYMNEKDGRIITVVASNYIISGNGTYYMEDAILINGYDKDLNTKFQQIFPVNSKSEYDGLKAGYNFIKNKLYIVANHKKGMFTNVGAFGILDINDGTWDKMEYLSKKHIGNSDYADGPSILWFGDNYIVPYFARKMFATLKYKITLQQNQY